MNEMMPVKRGPGRPRKQPVAIPTAEKPRLMHLEPLAAAQEAARNAQEGSVKLSRSIDECRKVLQMIASAEWDNERNRPVLAEDLRKMAQAFLSERGWRTLIETRVGDRNMASLSDQGYG